ncbi:MAG: hypothetical protein C7B45_17585 [Sulfobacillus acidophilus]|uniref:TraD/TraG TraM recognition site domain-containing protein n=1 Tax=Sulfobacillus acidophilus TaxID=53633 RepID=A0A2T2WCF2_9FIRM|nr:MAG: hypothetical protein C7B45_17585 [Sulfobacillus acidophilus]
MAQSRGAGVHTITATQDPGDYAAVSPQLPFQVLTNTAVKICHRVDSPDSAELIARTIGTAKGHEVTHQVQTANRSLGFMGSVRAVDEFIVHPQLIKALPTGAAAYSIKVPSVQSGVMQVFPRPS